MKRDNMYNLIRPALTNLIILLLLADFATASSFQDQLYDDYEIEVSGFIELRQGGRLQDDPHEKDESISEGRLQVDLNRDFEWVILQFKADLVGDLVEEEGRGELRELNMTFSPLDFMDLKAGRQTLTWGTGDLLFVNDLFSKDWKSFFIGRDDEYLKAASNALKASFFFDLINIDLVWSPIFNGSEYIDGSRLSYWNGVLGRTAGQDFIFSDHERNSAFNDGEYALRLFKTISGTELALYGYSGYWKTPEGLDPLAMKLIYPKLSVYGASARSPIFGGIGSIEMGYYDSREDRSGDDPLIRNSEFRFLAGFERDVAKDFTAGFQYYLEWMADYDDYEKTIGDAPKKDKHRHVLTLRLTKLLMNQTLKLSLFAYYSPSDEDAYLRPKVHYKLTDAWALEAGGNIFLGSDDHTFFGQFQDNTNAYAGIRWNY